MTQQSELKIIILAGGRGERLDTISLTRQKVIIPFFGLTLLEHAIKPYVDLIGSKKVYVVVDYFGNQVKEVLRNSKLNVKPVYITAQSPLAISPQDELLIVPGDVVISQESVRMFIKKARSYQAAILVCNYSDYKVRDRKGPLPKTKFVFVESRGDKVTRMIPNPQASYINSNLVAGGLTYIKGVCLGGGIDFSSYYHLLNQLISKGIKIGYIKHKGLFFDLDDHGDLKEGQFKFLRIFERELTCTNISRSAEISKDAVISGPVHIEAKAIVEGHTRLIGPLHIGEATVVKAGTYLCHSWIGKNCVLGPNTCISEASIGNNVKIDIGRDFCGMVLDNSSLLGGGCFDGFTGEGCTIFPGATIGDHPLDDSSVRTMIRDELVDTGWHSLGPSVGDGAIIGPNVKIMPGRHIGPEAIIDPNVVVVRNVPARSHAKPLSAII